MEQLETETIEKEDEIDTCSNADVKYIDYSVRIGANFFHRLNNHIRLRKHVGFSNSKQAWINEAIREKIESDKDKSLEDITGDKYLNIKINHYLNEEVEKLVEVIKKIRISFSKKQWLIEAILDKLDRDEPKIKQKFNERIHSTQPKK